MLSLLEITLFQFKNYANRSFRFESRITGICGANGAGKTNLLDAIHYLCFTRSYFTRSDQANVQRGCTGFRIEGQFSLQGQLEKTVCILRETGKKEFRVNDHAYEKFADHIGRYPCVIIAPDDAVLITGASEERRRFMDALLCQADAAYLQHLIQYQKILQQRNALLKSMLESRQAENALLDVLDQQLIVPGQQIFEKRKQFMVSFLPAVRHMYQEIARQTEDIRLVYDSQLLEADMTELLMLNRSRDLISGRSTAGIHRDDIEIRFHEQPFRQVASQGQRKSLLFALKLTEMDYLAEARGFPPLLLLDDVFEKLDENRISNLLEKVCLQNKGQVFITDTNAERLSAQLKNLNMKEGEWKCVTV
jgi:DNA replication and repair protein RecF